MKPLENISFVYDRLDEMEARPLMWAITREGFLMQALVLLEILGLDGREQLQSLALPQGPETLETHLKSNLDQGYAKEVVVQARTLIDRMDRPCLAV